MPLQKGEAISLHSVEDYCRVLRGALHASGGQAGKLPTASRTAGELGAGRRRAWARLRLLTTNVDPTTNHRPLPTAAELPEMQPFGRPVARAVQGHGTLGLELAARLALRLNRGGSSALVKRQPLLQCDVRAIGSSLRVYSTRPTSKEAEPSDPAATANNTTQDDATEAHQQRDLPSSKENRRSNVNRNFSHIMDTVQSRVVNASQTLNDLTGYSDIEAIKEQNRELETALSAAHQRVRTARLAYKTSNTKRANTQREVTTLLARKDSWSPIDLERFTELYRTDHILEGEVVTAQSTLTESEAEEQSLSQRLNAGILRRYHEEQIWSDRIRRASTWGTWGLMGMNFLLFVVLQFFAEPWRRRRLVKGVVEEEKQVLEQVRSELAQVKAGLEKTAALITPQQIELAPVTPEAAVYDTPVQESWAEVVSDPAKWKAAAADLYSERRIDLRMKDASILALQGVVAGAAVAAGMVLFLVRRP